MVHVEVHRVGAADADAECDVPDVSIRVLPLFIVEVTVPMAVSGGMDVDGHLPHRCHEE